MKVNLPFRWTISMSTISALKGAGLEGESGAGSFT